VGVKRTPTGHAIRKGHPVDGRPFLDPHLLSLRSQNGEAPRPQGGASRARSGEQDASKRNSIHVVPLNPAYKAGFAGHAPAKRLREFSVTESP
jgi:hypothetical protein